MKIAFFLDIIGRGETFSEHGCQVSGFRCQVSGVRLALAFSLLTPCMKTHHLSQKCSFFLIKLAAFQASG
jgi:hypothetical protein